MPLKKSLRCHPTGRWYPTNVCSILLYSLLLLTEGGGGGLEGWGGPEGWKTPRGSSFRNK